MVAKAWEGSGRDLGSADGEERVLIWRTLLSIAHMFCTKMFSRMNEYVLLCRIDVPVHDRMLHCLTSSDAGVSPTSPVQLNNQRSAPSTSSSLRSNNSTPLSPPSGFNNNNHTTTINNNNYNVNVNHVGAVPSTSQSNRRGSNVSRLSSGANVGHTTSSTPVDSRQNSVCLSRRPSLLGRLSHAGSIRFQTSFGSTSLDEYQHNDLGVSTCSTAVTAGYPLYAGDQVSGCAGVLSADARSGSPSTRIEKNWARAKKNSRDKSVESMTAAARDDELLVGYVSSTSSDSLWVTDADTTTVRRDAHTVQYETCFMYKAVTFRN